MFQLKTIPEDFIVTEIFTPNLNESGEFSIFILEKKNYSTLKAMQIIARELETRQNNIGYSGTKDKNAITRQYISIKFLKDKYKKDLNRNNELKLKYVGQSKEIISLGMHSSNHFDITARNIDSVPNLKIKQFVNYFDEQRFSENNIDTGIAIIKGDFKKVIENILKFYSNDEKIIEKINNKEQINIPENEESKIARDVIDILSKRKNDYVGALKTIPKKILQIYIKSLQSHIFNKIVSETIGNNHKTIEINSGISIDEYNIPLNDINNLSIPLIGFSTKIENLNIKKILDEYNIKERDFIIRQFPDLSEEGTFRNMITEASDINIGNMEDDELFSGKKKIKLSFSLEPGAYATIFLKHIFAE